MKDSAVPVQDDGFCGDWDSWEFDGRQRCDLFDSIEKNTEKGEQEMAY